MQTFPKKERLCRQKTIAELFEKGNSFLTYPLSVRWIIFPKSEQIELAKVLFVVSKRNFKHAVDRNRIKRLLRECYRKNKDLLYSSLQQQNHSISFSIVYVGKLIPNYFVLEKEITKALERLSKSLATQNEKQNSENK